MKFIKTLLFSSLVIFFVSCGSDSSDSKKTLSEIKSECKAPKIVLKEDGTYSCVEKGTCEYGTKTNDDGSESCRNYESKATSCSEDLTQVLDQKGKVMTTCFKDKYCEINIRGSPSCVE